MKNLSLVLIFCFANVFCFASNTNTYQNISDSLHVIVNGIAQSEVFEESGTVGFAGMPSQQNIRYNQLKQLASTSELIELTSSRSAIVRVYSFIALLNKHEVISPEIMNRMLNDKTTIVSINGCIAKDKTVSTIVKSFMSKNNTEKKA